MTAPLSPNDLFAGRYRIEYALGASARGPDYAAILVGGGRVRLTVLSPSVVTGAETRERFFSHTRRAAELPRDHFAPLVEAAIDDATGAPFVATGWIDGTTLADWINVRGGLAHDEARAVLGQLAAALATLHRVGFRHGALSPASILVSRPQKGPADAARLVIVDAAFAAIVATHIDSADFALRLAFGSPEFAQGRLLTDASDVWSFALIACLVLAGGCYFDPSSNVLELFNAMAQGAAIPPSERFPWEVIAVADGKARGLPPGFDAWFARCTSVDPARRENDIARAFADLAAQIGGGTPAPLVSSPNAAPPFDPPVSTDEVTPEHWPALFSSGASGIEVRAEEARVLHGGVEWTLPTLLTRSAATAIRDCAVRAAEAVVGGERRSRGLVSSIRSLWSRPLEALYTEMLSLRAIAPPFERPRPSYLRSALEPLPDASSPRAALDKKGLTFHFVQSAWISSHEPAPACTPYAFVPRALLPSGEELARRLVDAIADAGGPMTERPLRTCRFCGQSRAPFHMHDRTCCHYCAEVHLRIIH